MPLFGLFGGNSVHQDDSSPGTMMLDDSIGALTRSVYHSSDKTQQTFLKVHARLGDLSHKADLYTSHLTKHSQELAKLLKSSSFQIKRALMESTAVTNGVSDPSSAKVLAEMVRQVNKADTLLISAMKQKDLLKESLNVEAKAISEIARDVAAKTQKSFAVLSVSDHICQNAKALQSLSKSAVDKAERVHLANASAAIHRGVDNIRDVIALERKFVPYKFAPVGEVVPVSVDRALEDAFAHSNRAIDHAEKALTLSGSARTREIVDVRDELRNVLDRERDVLLIKARVTDKAIHDQIVPQNTRISAVIAHELFPKLKDYSGINDQILAEVDPAHANGIVLGLSKKVATQRGLELDAVRLACGMNRSRHQQLLAFL